MVDANRRPRIPNQVASPLEVVGFDGAPPIVGGVSDLQRPGVVNIQDSTVQSYQAMDAAITQSRQAVDSVSQTSSQVAQTAIQAAANSGPSTLARIIEPLAAGVELFSQVRRQRQETERQELSAQFEQQINGLATQLAFDVERQTEEEGYFTTRQSALQEAHRIAADFRQRGLPDSAITPILGIIQSAASTGLREDLTRFRQLAAEQRNTAADQAFSHLRLQLGPIIGGMSTAVTPQQLDRYIGEMYGQIDSFFTQYNITDPALRMQLQSMVMEQASEQAMASGNNVGLLANRSSVLADVTQMVNALTAEFNETGNYDLYQTSLRRLDAQFTPILGAGAIVGLASDPLANLGYQGELNTFARTEAEYQQQRFRQLMQTDESARNARQQIEVGLALDAFNNRGEGRDIISDTEHQMHAGVQAQYELITQDHERYLELYTRQLEYQETVARGTRDLNELLDSLNPTERLGLPTITDTGGIFTYQPTIMRVVAEAYERGQISEETLRANEQLFEAAAAVQQGTIQQELRNLQVRWEPWGVDISNLQNVSSLDQRVQGATDILRDVQRRVESQTRAAPVPFL